MANVLDQRIMVIASEGIISPKPIWIRKVIFRPQTAGHAATFTFWDENETATSEKIGQSVTVTASTRTFASSTNFPQSTINPDQIIKFSYSATGENLYTLQIATNADNNTITADVLESYHGTITDDTTEIYSWKVWTPKIAFTFVAPATELRYVTLDFGDKGYFFPNLAMHTLSGTSSALIYVR